MKTLKYFLSVFLIVVLVASCIQDELGSTDFIATAVAPSNLNALFNVTQDNSGLVTITPNGEGAVSYEISYGDNSDSVKIKQGETTSHTYAEGTYDVKIVATGITGLKTEVTKSLEVSFKAPENLAVEITNDLAISKQVNVTATADSGLTYDVYFGEPGNDTPVPGNIGETVSYVYQNAGTYTIRVVAKSAAIATTEYSEDFVVTAILQPLTSAPTPANRQAADVISIYSDAYSNVAGINYNPDWGQSGQGSSYAEFDLNGDKMLNYINLSYQGIALADGTSIDVSGMEFLHMDVWTADATKLETSLISLSSGEKPVVKDLTANQWTSIEIPISEYTSQGLSVSDIFQLKLVGTPWAAGTVFVDNIYFYKAPTVTSSVLDGTWKLAPEAGALGVGPNTGDISWWSNSLADVTTRACLFDDTYVFNSDGSFNNVLGADTWLEAWQGVAEGCGTPVAPHDGKVAATYSYDATAGTVTVNGVGAYLGIAKAYNGGELTDPANAPASITYNATLSDNDNTMILQIAVGNGVWQFKLVRDGVVAPPPPIAGTWKIAPEAGALGVGPNIGDTSWWSNTIDDVTTRACLFDDTYVFNSDGSFNNVLGADTWLETWQGVVAEGCGTPVAPHDGTVAATYSYDATAGTVTVNGVGTYLGIAKAYNGGELTDPANAPASITYNATLSNNDNTMILQIAVGNGAWQFKLVREGTSSGGGSGSGTQIDLPVDFESSTVDYTLTDFGDNSSSVIVDPTDANNMVAKVIKLATAATWAGTTIGTDTGFATNIPITLTNSKMSVRVWSPDAGIPVRLKIEDANDVTHTCETEINTSVAGGWETLVFDFNNEASGTETLSHGLANGWVYNKASIFFNFGTDGATAGEKTYYFDDVIFIAN